MTCKYDVLQMMTSQGASKLSTGVTATTTFEETELEKFKKSLNLNGIEAAIKKQDSATIANTGQINYLKSKISGISGNTGQINYLKSKIAGISSNTAQINYLKRRGKYFISIVILDFK